MKSVMLSIYSLQMAKKGLIRRICNEGAEDGEYHICDDACMNGAECCEVSIALALIDKEIKELSKGYKKNENKD